MEDSMGLPIGRRTCSALSAFWLCSAFVAAQQPGPDVKDCQPCALALGQKEPAFSFTFELKKDGDQRSVKAIRVVTPATGAIERLAVSDMEPIGAEDNFFFTAGDINFDGYPDLMLITNRGVANAYAD